MKTEDDEYDCFPDPEPEETDSDCTLCAGTGIGQHGDPDTSRCTRCGGRGYMIPDNDHEDWNE